MRCLVGCTEKLNNQTLVLELTWQIKAVQRGKKPPHCISETFQFKFTISLAILQRSYQHATVNLSTTDSQAVLSGARTPLFQEEKGGGEKKKRQLKNSSKNTA